MSDNYSGGIDHSTNPEKTLQTNCNVVLKTPFLRLNTLENKGISVCQNAGSAEVQHRTVNKSTTRRTHPSTSRSARTASTNNNAPRKTQKPRREQRTRRSCVRGVRRRYITRPIPQMYGNIRLRELPQQGGIGLYVGVRLADSFSRCSSETPARTSTDN